MGRRKLQRKRLTEYKGVLAIARDFPFGFEAKSKVIGAYATPVLTPGSELQLLTRSEMKYAATTTHLVL